MSTRPRKEYMLDENGQRIALPSGAFKSRKVDATDWVIGAKQRFGGRVGPKRLMLFDLWDCLEWVKRVYWKATRKEQHIRNALSFLLCRLTKG